MSKFNFVKNVKLQNLALRIHIILQHMLSNPKPKNIMTHYFQSSMLKTIQFYYILIYITYNCL